MTKLIIDLDTGTIIGTNIVVVDSMPDEDMSDSEIIEYGMKHGSAVMALEFTRSMDFEEVLESLATMPSSSYGSPAHLALVERAYELRGGV